jgi:hypothetical protein
MTCDSASITSTVSQWHRKQREWSQGAVRRVGSVGDNSNVVCGKKFSGQKGSVRRCTVLMKQPVPLLPKFGAKSSQAVMQLQ